MSDRGGIPASHGREAVKARAPGPTDITAEKGARRRRLRAAGHDVVVPVVADRAGPVDWARFDGPDALAAGPFGLWEPTGRRLGPGAVQHARLVLLPALAADRHGVRLGQGGGFYDRTLP